MKQKFIGLLQRKQNDGFTLIELLVVIIILGILAAVAIPSYMDMQKEAKIAAVKGTLSAIRGGLELAHAKILTSGSNTGLDGDNPDWPTLAEVQANELFLATRPESVRFLNIVRTDKISNEANKSLPECLLSDMSVGMSAMPAGVLGRKLADVTGGVRVATEESGWAYYPGNEKNSNGRGVSAVFYVNDDRQSTDNVDSSGKVPSQW